MDALVSLRALWKTKNWLVFLEVVDQVEIGQAQVGEELLAVDRGYALDSQTDSNRSGPSLEWIR